MKSNRSKRIITMLLSVIFIAAAVPVLFAEGQQETSGSEAEGEQEKVSEYKSFEGDHGPEWTLEASEPLLIGGYGDNFAYDGKNVTPVDGTATVEVNTAQDTGSMEVVFNGTIRPEKEVSYSGEIRLVYEEFSGAGSDFKEGGITDFVYLHGDSGQEAPVMPTVRTYLASWGPVDIYVDGEKVYEQLVGHMMLTEAARDQETYAIYDESGEGYYSPKEPGDFSIAQPDRRTLHFVAHTTKQDPDNFPPHTVWLHLNFQDVEEM
jgi:hypothetical protein